MLAPVKFPLPRVPPQCAWCRCLSRVGCSALLVSLQTVREEEREIYRQLLQMVTGKQFSTSKPSSLFPFHL